MGVLTGHCIDAVDNNESNEYDGGIGTVEEIFCDCAYFISSRSQCFDQITIAVITYLGGFPIESMVDLFQKSPQTMRLQWPVKSPFTNLRVTQYESDVQDTGHVFL